MGEDPSTGRPPVTAIQDPDRLEREIEQTRQEMGDTVEALARKTDVKAQAAHKLEETKAAVAEKKDELIGKAKTASPDTAANAAAQASQKARQNPLPLATIGAFAAGFIAGRAFKR